MAHFQTNNYFIVLGPFSNFFLQLYSYELSLPKLIQSQNRNHKKYDEQQCIYKLLILFHSKKLVSEEDPVLYRGILAISNYLSFHYYCKTLGCHRKSTANVYNYRGVPGLNTNFFYLTIHLFSYLELSDILHK